MPGRRPPRLFGACLALWAIPPLFAQWSPAPSAPAQYPAPEKLSYSIEWRLIHAGDAWLTLEPKKADKTTWESKLHLASGGLVSKLYKLEDNYSVKMEDQFCTTESDLDSVESKRHRRTEVSYDYPRGKANYVERDLIKDSVLKTAEVDIPACVADIIGGLYKLRSLNLEPGQWGQVALSDGKKSVTARVEAQEREQIKNQAGTFNTVRYEAYVFNGVLFARKAQMQVWLTDDARRLPVQLRARMGFPVGSITFELEKDEQP